MPLGGSSPQIQRVHLTGCRVSISITKASVIETQQGKLEGHCLYNIVAKVWRAVLLYRATSTHQRHHQEPALNIPLHNLRSLLAKFSSCGDTAIHSFPTLLMTANTTRGCSSVKLCQEQICGRLSTQLSSLLLVFSRRRRVGGSLQLFPSRI